MKTLKLFTFVVMIMAVFGCKEEEKKTEEPPICCSICPGPEVPETLVYLHLEEPPYQLHIHQLFEETMIVAEPLDQDNVSKLKLYPATLFYELFELSHSAVCAEDLPDAVDTLFLPLRQFSYTLTNGVHCSLSLAESDPLAVQLAELFNDVLSTGENNEATPVPETDFAEEVDE